MKWVVQKDNKFYVVGTSGHKPDGAIGIAPDDASFADGDYIEIVNGVITLNKIKKYENEIKKLKDNDDTLKEQEALKYLNSTNWLFIRELEAGIPMPKEVKNKRIKIYSQLSEK